MIIIIIKFKIALALGKEQGKWDQEGRGIQGTLFIFLIVFKIFIF